MTGDEKDKIIGEDYVDFIIDKRTNNKISDLFPEALIKSISDIYAVVYIPINQVNAKNISPLRWIIPPKLFGLTSEINLEASGVNKLRRIPSFDLKGEGVLIGIVDTGINYTLPAFLKLNGKSKIISIWDQTIQSDTPLPYDLSFGTEYSNEQINQALQSENPLSLVPTMDKNGHGTMLAGVAAGTEDTTKEFNGVASDAELVVVKLALSKQFIRHLYSIPEGPVCFQESNIMWGVNYCVEAAKQQNRPIVLCIGVGTSQGAHDGTSPLSQQLSSFADKQGIGIVTTAGNEGNSRRHFSGTVEPSRNGVVVELNVGEKDKSFTMELWGDSPGIYSIDIVSPYGEYIPRIFANLRLSRTIRFIFDSTTVDIEYQTVENQTGDELIFFNFHDASPGIWKFTVYGRGNLPGKFNIWLPMGEFISKNTFFIQYDNYTTLVTPGDSLIPITITAYNSMNNSLYVDAGKGYTRNNTIKPELAAPGVNYLAPDIKGGYIYYSGTGVAAAHTAGIVAITLEWGLVKRNQESFDTNEIKKYMIRGAKRSTNLTYPNRDWGYGIIDIFNTFDALRQNI